LLLRSFRSSYLSGKPHVGSLDASDAVEAANKPFEWTGRHHLSAAPPQAPRLPLKGGVRRIKLIQSFLYIELNRSFLASYRISFHFFRKSKLILPACRGPQSIMSDTKSHSLVFVLSEFEGGNRSYPPMPQIVQLLSLRPQPAHKHLHCYVIFLQGATKPAKK
jgi:hypothetical protein